MSKKISLILAIVLALVGVVAVSIFGKIPEYLQPKIYMEEIYFEDEDIIVNKVGSKIYYFDINRNNLSIDIYSMVAYKPLDTTNIDMSFTISNTDIATMSSTGFLTFYEDSIEEFSNITVTVMSKDGTNLTDKIIIMNAVYANDKSEGYKDFEF